MSPLSHHRNSHPQVPATDRGQSGYVIVMVALMIVPLLLMVGLSVDVGHWYNRGSNIQKAADAAALAGAARIGSDGSGYEAVAREAAAKNGFAHDPSGTGIVVDVDRVGDNRVHVTITDPHVRGFLTSGITGRTINMSRQATGQYVLPVALGSPDNQFGGVAGVSDPVGADVSNMWANIMSAEATVNYGDAYTPQCRQGPYCTTRFNDWSRDSGYLYTIDVAPGTSNMSVEVFDAGIHDRHNERLETGDTRWQRHLFQDRFSTVHYTFYDRDDTVLNVNDNPRASTTGRCAAGTPGEWSILEGTQAGTYMNQWQSVCTVGGAVPPGRYLLRVQITGNSAAVDRYAICAVASGVQPRVSAYNDMSLMANVDAQDKSFYLAEITPDHAGKVLEVGLFDPGEGTGQIWMEPRMPDGSLPNRCVATHDGPGDRPPTFTSGDTLSPCRVQTTAGTGRFNGLWIWLRIVIPNDYECDSTSDGCWWRINYDMSGQMLDTTTWTARVVGDPVHLVED